MPFLRLMTRPSHLASVISRCTRPRHRRRVTISYFSYYAAGFRVAEIVNDNLVEMGHYIDTGGNNFWGVQVFQSGGQEYVAASDRDFGLYIFRYTGS